MPDHFATLAQPRRPWLDPEQLKEAFLNRSAEVHPDRLHNASRADRETAQAQYTALNQAYQSLRNPKERLRHLIELETHAKPASVQSVPEGLLETFVQITPRLREADSLAARKANADSPLLQARLLQQSQGVIDQLHDLQERLERDRTALESELKQISGAESDPRKFDWLRLEEIYRRLSYLDRWSSQIRETLFHLSP